MKTALLTGATGYIGGAIGAELIRQGYRILALTRGEQGRVARNIRASMTGFGWDAPDHLSERIHEHAWDLASLSAHPLIAEVDVVFHSAVEMSFSALRLSESFEFNLRGTLGLYDLVARHAGRSPRFIYISTAYTGGVGERLYPEALHVSPHILNPYQASKLSTELALHLRASRSPSLPVTLFRPTVVVGHRGTGWYGGQSYGLYNYLDSVHAGLAAGATELRFNIDPDVAHDYVFIDTLIDDIRIVMEREKASFSIVHSTGTRNSNAWRMERIGAEFGVPIHFEKPVTKADRIANRNQPFNEPFNVKGLVWNFEAKHIASLTGEERQVPPMNDETFSRLLKWYRANRLT